MLTAVWESVIVFFGTYMAVTVADKRSGPTGDGYTVFEFGVIVFTLIVIVVNVRVAMMTHFHHWFFQVRHCCSRC